MITAAVKVADRNELTRSRSRQRLRSTGLLLTVALLVLAGAVAGCSSLPKSAPGATAVKNQAAAYAAQGNSYYQQGNYVQAEKFFKLALDSNFSVDNRVGISSSYTSLGRVYLAAGDTRTAGAAFEDAIRYASPATTPDKETLVLDAETGKAEILLVQGRYENALDLLLTAEKRPAPPETAQRAALLHDVGAAYKGLGDYSSALTYLNQAREAHVRLKLVSLEASDLYMIASVYSKQGDYSSALAYANQALEMDKLIENSLGIGSDLRALGIISEKQAKLQDAYDYYYSSLQVFRTLGMAAEVQNLLGALEPLARRLGKTKEAATFADALKQMGTSK